jgi:hypothetical protein
MPKRNGDKYYQKALMYDLLANYYKYSRPDLHIHYYQKHLKSMNKATRNARSEPFLPEQPYAKIRVLHASGDVPNVDIFMNEVRIYQDIPYKTLGTYLSLPGGKYQIDIYPTGKMASALISKKVTVAAGKHYTLAAAGPGDNLRLVSIEDDPFVPEGETKVRFVHLSPDAPAVDIAVQNGDVVFHGVSFRKATEYLGLTPMVVDLEVQAAGTGQIILPLKGQRFEPDSAYTVYLAGFAGKSPGLEAISFTP